MRHNIKLHQTHQWRDAASLNDSSLVLYRVPGTAFDAPAALRCPIDSMLTFEYPEEQLVAMITLLTSGGMPPADTTAAWFSTESLEQFFSAPAALRCTYMQLLSSSATRAGMPPAV
jgi:hypothetical protein